MLRGILLNDTGRVNQENEARRRAIHHRNLRRIHLDEAVVDPKTVEGAHQMLDRGHARLTDIHRRREPRVIHVRRDSRNIHGRREVRPTENNTGAGSGRLHHEMNSAAAVQTDSDGRDRFPQRSLLQHKKYQ